jgi:hypothetical protein
MVSLETFSIIYSSTTLPVSRRMVHRVHPLGDFPQTRAIILAFVSPVVILGLVCLVLLNFRAYLIP